MTIEKMYCFVNFQETFIKLGELADDILESALLLQSALNFGIKWLQTWQGVLAKEPYDAPLW